MTLNEKKGLTLAGIGSVLVVITTILANTSEIWKNTKESNIPTEQVIVAEETEEESSETIIKHQNEEEDSALSPEITTEPIPTEPKTEFSLSELTPYHAEHGDCVAFLQNLKDNIGNDYNESLTTKTSPYYIPNITLEYYLNQQYTNFSGILYLPEEQKDMKNKTELKIYSDDNMIYSAEIKGGSLPDSFSIDITNTTILKIYIYHYLGVPDNCIGIGNPVLTIAQTE